MITYIHVYSVTCLTLIHTAFKITAVDLLLVGPITERCQTVHHAKKANNLNKKTPGGKYTQHLMAFYNQRLQCTCI